jgi:hypothetical protein
VLLAELCHLAIWFCQTEIAQGGWAELATKGVGKPLKCCIAPISTRFGTNFDNFWDKILNIVIEYLPY